MKKIYLIFSLLILALFSGCEAFDDTTYQIYYDSYSQSNSVKRIELREFNEKEGNFENQRTIQLKKGDKSEIYCVDSDIAYVEVLIAIQYTQTQEQYHINICHLNKGEDNLIRISALK
jgi:hypothetical protein